MSEQRILIVEDEPKIAGLLADYLQAMGGYRTEVLARGDVVLAQVRAEPPDLVLLDVMMRDIDGFEALKRIRQRYSMLQIPVIMITTKDQETDKVWAKRQGASEYLVKPVAQQALLSSIDNLLKGIA